jgi:hypothetical protein
MSRSNLQTVANQSASPPESNRPLQTLRHRNLKAVIWRNTGEKGPRFSVTVSRQYRDGETWKESHSFSYNEIMNVAKLLADAHSFITELVAKEKQAASKQTPPPAPRTRRGEKSG